MQNKKSAYFCQLLNSKFKMQKQIWKSECRVRNANFVGAIYNRLIPLCYRGDCEAVGVVSVGDACMRPACSERKIAFPSVIASLHCRRGNPVLETTTPSASQTPLRRRGIITGLLRHFVPRNDERWYFPPWLVAKPHLYF